MIIRDKEGDPANGSAEEVIARRSECACRAKRELYPEIRDSGSGIEDQGMIRVCH